MALESLKPLKKISLKAKLLVSVFLLSLICTGLTFNLLSLGFVLSFSISILVTGVVAFIIISILLAPLKKMLLEFQDIAEFRKNLSHQFTIKSGDEVEEIASYANSLFQSTWLMINKVGEASGNSLNMAEKINESLAKSSSSSQEICSTMEQIAQGASSQAAEMTTTSQHAQSLRSAIREVTLKTNQAASTASQVANAAELGNAQMSQVVHKMKMIQQSVDKSCQTIVELGTKSEQINQIVEIINGIANQTNLLALNAAIEAARAGEQGRGFAVVAEEVRQLAEQSAEATQQIAQLIQEIQQTTQIAVKVMEEGTAEFHEGTKGVQDTGKELEQIIGQIGSLSSMLQSIAQIIQQQDLATEEVGSTIQHISSLSQEMATGTGKASLAIQEQNFALNEIVTSTNQLIALASNLNRMVEKCKS